MEGAETQARPSHILRSHLKKEIDRDVAVRAFWPTCQLNNYTAFCLTRSH